MIFLSAQPDETYFIWQLELCIRNFNCLGIDKNSIHILIGYDPSLGQSPQSRQLKKDYEELACIYAYPDKREKKEYRSSIRPNIIKQHYKCFPELGNEVIFYHDSDILFTDKLPDFNKMSSGDEWHVSDTRSYLGIEYIRKFGEGVLDEMCEIIGIDKDTVIQNDENVGGAQYILKGIDKSFWEKIEKDSENLYTHLKLNADKYAQQWAKSTGQNISEYQEIYAWCADMWALLWNGYKLGKKIRIEEQLDFCWPAEHRSEWDKKYIFHNAGVQPAKAINFFHKASYLNSCPYFDCFGSVSKSHCSYEYVNRITAMGLSYYKDLTDTTFILSMEGENKLSIDNALATIRYLKRHFDTHILVCEVGETPELDGSVIPDVQYRFFANTHMAKLLNQVLSESNTSIVFKYNINYVIPPNEIYSTILKVRHDEVKVCYLAGNRSHYVNELLRSYFIAESDVMPLLNYKIQKGVTSNLNYKGAGIAFNTAFLKARYPIYNERIGWSENSDEEMLSWLEDREVLVGQQPGTLFSLIPQTIDNFTDEARADYLQLALSKEK